MLPFSKQLFAASRILPPFFSYFQKVGDGYIFLQGFRFYTCLPADK